VSAPGSVPRPDWSGHDLLDPWRRCKVELPYTATERSEAQTQARVLALAAITGVVVSASIFAVLVWAGLFPEIHRDPAITQTGDRGFLIWFIPGAGLLAAAILLGLMSFVFVHPAPGAGHPFSFEATEQGLSLRDIHGRVFTGPWADWRLETYDVLHLPKGGQVLSALYLSLIGMEYAVRMMNQRKLSRFLRMAVQKIAG
jgi:hypothetical protein